MNIFRNVTRAYALFVVVLPVFSQQGIPTPLPALVTSASSIIQRAIGSSTGTKVDAISFSGNTQPGGTIIFACGGSQFASSTWSISASDTLSLTFINDVQVAQSTTQWSAIFHAINNVGGADTVTLTVSGASSANQDIGCQLWEMQGVWQQSIGATAAISPLDQKNSGSNASSTAVSAGTLQPSVMNGYAFMATFISNNPGYTAGTGWAIDGSQGINANTSTFTTTSQFVSSAGVITGNATLGTAQAWASVVANYKPAIGTEQFGGALNVRPASGAAAFPVSQSGTWTVQPGNTANTTPWLVKPNDGTTSLTIKAASTAAVATDTAIVVALSPNNGVNQTGTWTVQPGNTPNTSAWLVQAVPGTGNGLTWFNLEPAASDNHANIKNGAGVVYHIFATNNSATINYMRLYNAATGFNGCNSATNLVWSGIIPASSTNAAGFVDDIPMGITFSTGISICVTGAYGQTSTTNATASAMEINVGYK